MLCREMDSGNINDPAFPLRSCIAFSSPISISGVRFPDTPSIKRHNTLQHNLAYKEPHIARLDSLYLLCVQHVLRYGRQQLHLLDSMPRLRKLLLAPM